MTARQLCQNCHENPVDQRKGSTLCVECAAKIGNPEHFEDTEPADDIFTRIDRNSGYFNRRRFS